MVTFSLVGNIYLNTCTCSKFNFRLQVVRFRMNVAWVLAWCFHAVTEHRLTYWMRSTAVCALIRHTALHWPITALENARTGMPSFACRTSARANQCAIFLFLPARLETHAHRKRKRISLFPMSVLVSEVVYWEKSISLADAQRLLCAIIILIGFYSELYH